MYESAIPRPRGAHAAPTPTDSAYWDAELDALLAERWTVEHDAPIELWPAVTR